MYRNTNVSYLAGCQCFEDAPPYGLRSSFELEWRELIREYVAHYHAERPHQGLGSVFIQPSNDHAVDGPRVS